MKRSKILIGAAHVMLAILMILLAVFLYTGLSTGWFASNKEVTATGMSVQLKGLHLGDIQTQIQVSRDGTKPYPGEQITGQTLLPGDNIRITAEFNTLKDSADPAAKIPVEFLIQTPPDAQGKTADLPVEITKGGKKVYCYLSSQIWVQSAVLSEKGGAMQTELMNDSKSQEKNWLSEHEPFEKPQKYTRPAPDIPLGRKVPTTPQTTNQHYELDQGKSYQLVINLKFHNDPKINQSPLRGNIRENPVVSSSFWREIVVNEIY